MNEEELTAYHEAGHAVVGFALGARVEHVRLDDGVSWHDVSRHNGDDNLPARFGECRVNWGRVPPPGTGPLPDWQLQRELLTMLAGPVAEMIYRDDATHPALHGPSQGDWAQAWERCREIAPDPQYRTRLLEQLVLLLRHTMSGDAWWAAIAAVADELLAHGVLDEEQTSETLGFWVSRMG